MSGISAYILSIAGVVLISIIVDFAMPNGSMNRYIKSVMGFFVIAVVLAPIPNLISKNNVTSFFDVGSYEIQDDYINYLNKSKIDTIVNEIKTSLQAEGYQNVIIDVSCSKTDESRLNIKSVVVDLTNLVILDKAEHKNINEIKSRIDSLIIEKFEVDEGAVKYET